MKGLEKTQKFLEKKIMKIKQLYYKIKNMAFAQKKEKFPTTNTTYGESN